jgi:hypothetical protein
VNVTVTTPNGTSANAKKDRFKYKRCEAVYPGQRARVSALAHHRDTAGERSPAEAQLGNRRATRTGNRRSSTRSTRRPAVAARTSQSRRTRLASASRPSTRRRSRLKRRSTSRRRC